MNTYDLFPKVLRTPTSGISPEKKLVDKFLRHTEALKQLCYRDTVQMKNLGYVIKTIRYLVILRLTESAVVTNGQ